ncbi:MAG: PA2169 family four-helix-bundle protein [Solimonas sp.]
MNSVDTIELLNHLIVTSKNGERGLRAAADEAHHADLKQSLLAYSQFFGDAARELQQAVRELGGHPREIGTFGATLHRTWMHLKVTALGRDEDVILDDVEEDEGRAESRFAEAAREETPEPIHAMLARHCEMTQRHHDVLREWRMRQHQTMH